MLASHGMPSLKCIHIEKRRIRNYGKIELTHESVEPMSCIIMCRRVYWQEWIGLMRGSGSLLAIAIPRRLVFAPGTTGNGWGWMPPPLPTAPILLCSFLNGHHKICFEIGTEIGGGGATRRFVLVRRFLISVWLEHSVLWGWRCYHEILVHHNLSSKTLTPWENFAQWNDVRSTVFANRLRDTLAAAV